MARKTGSKNCPRPTTPIRISRTMIVCGMGKGKYPPAKPGALGFEPLKAACRPLTLAPVPHSETHATKEYLTRSGPRKAQRPFSHANRKKRTRLSRLVLPSEQIQPRSPATVGNVKLLLPPRQSRGNSQDISPFIGWPTTHDLSALTPVFKYARQAKQAPSRPACADSLGGRASPGFGAPAPTAFLASALGLLRITAIAAPSAPNSASRTSTSPTAAR